MVDDDDGDDDGDDNVDVRAHFVHLSIEAQCATGCCCEPFNKDVPQPQTPRCVGHDWYAMWKVGWY